MKYMYLVITEEMLNNVFLATLVALNFTPVSKQRVSRSFGLQPSSVAWSLRACYFVKDVLS